MFSHQICALRSTLILIDNKQMLQLRYIYVFVINVLYHFIVACETFYLNIVSWALAKILDKVKNPQVQLCVNYIIHEISK